MVRALVVLFACVGCASTVGQGDAAAPDVPPADEPSSDVAAVVDAVATDVAQAIDAAPTDAGCGALANAPVTAATACPSGEQCPECTGAALVDGLYYLTSTEVYASACGSFAATGALRLTRGSIEWVTVLSHVGGPDFENDHESASYTVEGNTLHLASRCRASSFDLGFGTSPTGRLELRSDAGTYRPASVYQRQP